MCIIIQRQPNFVLPFEKFKNAVINNPHGYGISFPDAGRLTVLKSPEEPDVDELYKLVNEELIDKNILLHLRWKTAGGISLRNAHPFPVLEKGIDGIDLRMAHNGTISSYIPKADKAKDESDTRSFVRQFVRPLFKRLIRGMEPEELLGDTFVKELLEDAIPRSSVLSFIDGEGNTLNCNAEGNGGKQEDEWYYSNSYSFDTGHRDPAPVKTYYNTGYSTHYGSNSYDYWDDFRQVQRGGSDKTVIPYKNDHKVSLPPMKLVDRKVDTSELEFKDVVKDSAYYTPRFTTKFGMADIFDALTFQDDTIEGICSEPENSSMLIKELLEKLSTIKGTLKNLNERVNRLQKQQKVIEGKAQ